MIVILGNNSENITKNALVKLSQKFEETHIDFGTGDGRYVYKKATQKPYNLYIGIDPSQDQLKVYSKKILKNNVENALLAVGSIENPPEEIFGIADLLSIILPWGTLLQAVTKPNEKVKVFNEIIKDNGKLELVFGYTPEQEEKEVERLELPILNPFYIQKKIIPYYELLGYILVEFNQLQKEDLKKFESTWSKKLAFGTERPIYQLIFKKTK